MPGMASQVQDMRNFRKRVYDRANDFIRGHQETAELCSCSGCQFAEELIDFISKDDRGNPLCMYCNSTPPLVKNLQGVFACPTCGAKLSI